jgi:pantoate--beta-alanine ligase
MTQLVHTRNDLGAVLAQHSRVLIPTMGALHLGHKSLVDAAKVHAGELGDALVVMSIFVNPLQFEDANDLAAYPRDLVTDSALATEWGVDVIWAPSQADIYGGEPPAIEPELPSILSDSKLSDQLEGSARPGHFQGVLTAVSYLFDAVRPQAACFGEKDFQQLALVRLLAARFAPPIKIIAVPTSRDEWGMARASRLGRLSDSGLGRARVIPKALAAGVEAARAGSSPVGVKAAVIGELDVEPGLQPDYVEIVDEACLPVMKIGPARIVLAVEVGGVRIIDNQPIELKAI